MSRPRPVLAPLVALWAGLALLSGCSSTSTSTTTSSASATATTSQQGNESQLCDAARAYAASVTSFKDTLRQPNVTLDQVRSAGEQVAKSFSDLAQATKNVAQDRVDAVKAAQEKFASTLKVIPDDATLTQAVDSLRDDAANIQAALSDLTTEVKC